MAANVCSANFMDGRHAGHGRMNGIVLERVGACWSVLERVGACWSVGKGDETFDASLEIGYLAALFRPKKSCRNFKTSRLPEILKWPHPSH